MTPLRALAFAALAACGGDHICTNMFVPDELTLELVPAIEDAGSWRVEADGIGCTVALPLEQSVFDCDDGATFDTEGTALTRVHLAYASDEVVLRLLLDDVEVFSDTRAPKWSESEPNGEGCGVTRTGTETLEWSN